MRSWEKFESGISGEAKGRACRARHDRRLFVKNFSVSELIANVVSAFVDKLHNLNGFIIPVSLPGPVLLTPCAETVYRNAHVRSRARK